LQERVGASVLVGGLWDPTLNTPTFLEKALLSTQAKEKLESLEEDQLVEQAVRQLGQALAANCLAISKLRGWQGSAKKESDKVVKLSRQVDGLQHESSKLHQEQEESRALLIEKSKEALNLSTKNAKLQAEVENLKEELAKRGEELIQMDEKLEKVREALTDDAANSYQQSTSR